jgi:hypothetical protein
MIFVFEYQFFFKSSFLINESHFDQNNIRTHDLIRGLKRFDMLDPMAQELTNH